MTNPKYRFWLEDKQYMVYSVSFTVSFVDMDTMEARYMGKGTNYIPKSGIKMDYTGFNDVNGKPIYFGDIVSKTNGWSEDISLISLFDGEAFLNRIYDGAFPLDKFVECYVVGNKYEDNLLFEKYLNIKAEKLKGVTNKDQVKEYKLELNEPSVYIRKRGEKFFTTNEYTHDNSTLYLVFNNGNRYKINKVNDELAEEAVDTMEKILLTESSEESISEYGLSNILHQICHGYHNLVSKYIKESYRQDMIIVDSVWHTIMFNWHDGETILTVAFEPYIGEVLKRYKDGLAIMKCEIKCFDKSLDKQIYLDNKGIAEAIETINSVLEKYEEEKGKGVSVWRV